jgi:hypothetical protein
MSFEVNTGQLRCMSFEVNTGQLRCMSFEVNTGQLRCISFEVNTGQLRCMSFEVLIDVTFTYFYLIERGTVYITALIWNTHIKKIRKCSNISVKKYQNTPMFGVRSGTVRLKIKQIFQQRIPERSYVKLKETL